MSPVLILTLFEQLKDIITRIDAFVSLYHDDRYPSILYKFLGYYLYEHYHPLIMGIFDTIETINTIDLDKPWTVLFIFLNPAVLAIIFIFIVAAFWDVIMDAFEPIADSDMPLAGLFDPNGALPLLLAGVVVVLLLIQLLGPPILEYKGFDF